MSALLQYEKDLPFDFFSTKSAMWILDEQTGKIRMSSKNQIHAQIWGSEAWNNELRGYYNDSYGIITCHGHVSDTLMQKLAKKFPRAIFYRQGW
jgi:hypothetical protein